MARDHNLWKNTDELDYEILIVELDLADGFWSKNVINCEIIIINTSM